MQEVRLDPEKLHSPGETEELLLLPLEEVAGELRVAGGGEGAGLGRDLRHLEAGASPEPQEEGCDCQSGHHEASLSLGD